MSWFGRLNSRLPGASRRRVAGRRAQPWARAAGQRPGFDPADLALGLRNRIGAHRRTLIGVVGGMTIGITGVAGIITISTFRIERVSVLGTETVPAKVVLETTKLSGRGMFEISDRSIVDSLAGIPRIKGVTVVRHLPSDIDLLIEERRPWAVWQAGQGSFVIDEDGVVIEPAPAKHTLPVLVYAGTGTIRPGTRVQPEPVQLALQLDRALPERVRVKAKRFEYSEAGGLLVVTDQGWQARFGTGDDLDYKLATLQSILESTRARQVKFTAVDLRFGLRPFIR